ncbi:hypothetical protein SDC9_191311 [bioreactor metagenome]|uniref:Secretion system C-terminal sorting domain-containing protein n=1 Tax=bioreactor metagenome TaxID=1076179 RepID=A0A645HXJ2_9ZZZZ
MKKFTITATYAPTDKDWGKISPEGIIEVNEGESKKFTITPKHSTNGIFVIKELKVDGRVKTIGNLSSVMTSTFENINSDITIHVVFDSTASIGDVSIPELSISPNPTTDGKVIVETGNVEINKIEVVNASGNIIIAIENPTTVLDLSNLNKGSYFVRFYTEKGITSRKVVKN